LIVLCPSPLKQATRPSLHVKGIFPILGREEPPYFQRWGDAEEF
jgi:hypothetical protein